MGSLSAAMGGERFDATEYDTSQRSTLPLGIYRIEVEQAEIKDTKDGQGKLLATTYNVVEPDSQKGRKFFANINIANRSPQAQKIGREELAKLCRSIGIPTPDEPDDLKFKSFVVKVGLEKPQAGYEQKNRIVRYYYPDEGEPPEPKIDEQQPAPMAAPANDNASTARSTQNGGSAATRPAALAKLPWQKK